ncbi:MAG: cytochrome c biogenesis protein CcdA [Proteobacteria bacterium]|nr:cytochrome c biogenesis protein CcdA [Pseudomonadota bacterium]
MNTLFAFAAGVLSALSPCVLPILPIIFGAAVAKHRLGPVVLAAGIAMSFTLVGIFIATVGFELGLDQGVFRSIAAVLLIGIGPVMIVPKLQQGFLVGASHLTSWVSPLSEHDPGTGLLGQFLLGLSLGVVWSPCTGPTLGAASVLAAQGRDLPDVALTMLVFGLGAALPLAAVGAVSQRVMGRWRRSLYSVGHRGKIVLGIVAGLTGAAILTGLDKPLESFLVEISPAWLTRLTTRF